MPEAISVFKTNDENCFVPQPRFAMTSGEARVTEPFSERCASFPRLGLL